LPGAGAKPPEREVHWTSQAEQDREHWRRSDRRILVKIDRLVEDIREHPFSGIGKPEPLRYAWSGYWSRRITGEHRLVYRIEGTTVFIAQCRFHYD
jgi:toxin YoeB